MESTTEVLLEIGDDDGSRWPLIGSGGFFGFPRHFREYRLEQGVSVNGEVLWAVPPQGFQPEVRSLARWLGTLAMVTDAAWLVAGDTLDEELVMGFDPESGGEILSMYVFGDRKWWRILGFGEAPDTSPREFESYRLERCLDESKWFEPECLGAAEFVELTRWLGNQSEEMEHALFDAGQGADA